MHGTAAYSDKEFKDRGLTGSDCGGPLGGSFSTFNVYPPGWLHVGWTKRLAAQCRRSKETRRLIWKEMEGVRERRLKRCE